MMAPSPAFSAPCSRRLISITIGLVLTVVVRRVMVAVDTDSYFRPAPMTCTSLTGLLIFAICLLLLFRNEVAITRVSLKDTGSRWVHAGGRLSRHGAHPLALHNPETDDAPLRLTTSST